MKTSINPEPTIIIIFGITGDLAHRKLFPAIIDLLKANLLNQKTTILGITRQEVNTEQLLGQLLSKGEPFNEESINLLRTKLIVQTLDVENSQDYPKLLSSINEIEASNGECMNRLFYLSVPPRVIGTIVKNLADNGLNKNCEHDKAQSRILAEKPFGYDLESAKELIDTTSKYFQEEQMFRIDHYLAKETVQNILSFRFSNAIFESIWDSAHINKIEINATERIGIEGRASFYEGVGALRDFIQSHLLQLLSVIAMEQPSEMSSEAIHASRLELLKSVQTPKSSNINEIALRGQYRTYREEVGLPDSFVETYAAMEVFIDSERWKDVPIIIRTGKSLDKKQTDIQIHFSYKENWIMTDKNVLTFRIQPNEGIDLELQVKKPGLDYHIERVNMDFSYGRFFDANSQPDAYERVLIDAIRGDHTLFATSGEVLEAWRIVDPILQAWAKDKSNMLIYDDNAVHPEDLPNWTQ